MDNIFRNSKEKYSSVNVPNQNGDSGHGSVSSDLEEWTPQEMSNILCWLNFFTIDRDNPGVFLGTFLLLRGWPEGHIGVVAFIKEIVSLFFQTPMGDMIDKTCKKREYLCAADFVLAITSFTFIFYHSYGWVAFCIAIQGFFLTIVPPGLYGITLGMVGSRRLSEQSSLNEVYKHGGVGIRSLLIGITSYYGEDYWIFLFVVLSAMVAIPLVMRIKPHMIDDNKARGLVPDKKGIVASEATSYEEILRDRNIIILLLTVFFYHFGNAAMLPLLSQYLALDHSRAGVLITALNLAISHLLMIPSALWVGKKVFVYGTKFVFMVGLLLVPIRGLMIIALVNDPRDTTVLLILTQVLNGLSEGIYFVVVVIITEQLTRGSGRFNFLYGLVTTSMAVAGAFSNLIGNLIAEYEGYSGAFLFLVIFSTVPCVLYGVMMSSSIESPFPDSGETMSSHGVPTGLNMSNHPKDEESEVVFREDLNTNTAVKYASSPPRKEVEMSNKGSAVLNPMLDDKSGVSL